MPSERIGLNFVERAIGADNGTDREAPTGANPQLAKVRAWIGSAVDRLRDMRPPTVRRD